MSFASCARSTSTSRLSSSLRRLGVGIAVAGLLALLPSPSDAHPLDRLLQHLLLAADGTGLRATVAIGGGMIANEAVLRDIDPNGDGIAIAEEQAAFAAIWAADTVTLVDSRPSPLDPATISITVPDLEAFHVGSQPLLLTFPIPAPLDAAEHTVGLRIGYRLDWSDFRFDVFPGAGATIAEESWPGRTMQIRATLDPSAATGEQTAIDTAAVWSGNELVAKVRRQLERPKTAAFLLLSAGFFALLGILHAIQPGHGKTLVAAYLVATGGKPRDALALAGIVTFTHTISVFLLGIATLAASQLFLPSRVIPVMSALSGLLVAAIGATMLWRAVRSRRPHRRVNHDHAQPHANDTHHRHHHHHDHAFLSDEEHARLHLEEAIAARRLSKRGLVAMGVSGGIVPCPDALAILLLAIGAGQAAFGLFALVAFSAGLAGVLTVLGLSIALAGPLWARLRPASGDERRLARVGRRLIAASPMISATVVLVLGLAMAWSAVAL